MCNTSMTRARRGAVAQIDGRPVLQPAASNRVFASESPRPAKKSISSPAIPVAVPLPSVAGEISIGTPPPAGAADRDDTSGAVDVDKGRGPASPSTAANCVRPVRDSAKASAPSVCGKPKVSPTRTVVPAKRSDDPNGLGSSGDQPASPAAALRKKHAKKSGQASILASANSAANTTVPLLFPMARISTSEPGSIAAAQREQATLRQAQRKMRIAHYSRTPGKAADISGSLSPSGPVAEEEKRCSFITANSDPVYVAYHDNEWGVPVHDDNMLFELLVLGGALVGLDWTAILKKRDSFRAAFAGFDAEVVAKLSEKQMAAIGSRYRIDLGSVRSVVENARRILEVKEEFGSLDEYIWGFVSRRPISTRYSSGRKIPVKTSKSEAISKDMIRRGFRLAGPAVVHSFMQAAGLTNDHLVSCPRHHQLQQQVAAARGAPAAISPAPTCR